MAKKFGMIEQVKQEPVTLEDVRAIVEAMDKLAPEQRCFETSVGQLVELFPGNENTAKRMAISFRMTAFSQLVEDADKLGFSFLMRPDGYVNVNEHMLAAIAETPLIECDEKLIFDTIELFRRAKEHEAQEMLE